MKTLSERFLVARKYCVTFIGYSRCSCVRALYGSHSLPQLPAPAAISIPFSMRRIILSEGDNEIVKATFAPIS
jgi:hypothetical protein